MQEKKDSVAAASAAVGLNIHKGRCKILRYNTTCTNRITIDGEDLEDVKIFTYLEGINDEHSGSGSHVKARIGKEKAAYLQLKSSGTQNNCRLTPRSEFSIQMSKQFYCMRWKPGELRKPSSRKHRCFLTVV
ncbi:unnamed protein product [Schistosoma mattheei]|uniref:Uncharacterized protein n=1 Tax=Schistosoma mattheei TaxID=31246 RepID=A0A183P7V6_9TREM|nr:unnamed protein product [Schistosoma mattheei]